MQLLSVDHSTLTLPGVGVVACVPASIALEHGLHELGEVLPCRDLEQEVDMVGHEAVVIEFGRVALLGSAQEL